MQEHIICVLKIAIKNDLYRCHSLYHVLISYRAICTPCLTVLPSLSTKSIRFIKQQLLIFVLCCYNFGQIIYLRFQFLFFKMGIRLVLHMKSAVIVVHLGDNIRSIWHRPCCNTYMVIVIIVCITKLDQCPALPKYETE